MYSGGVDSVTVGGKCLAFHAIHERAAVERRHGDGQRGLCKAVDRKLRLASKPVRRKALRETLQGFRIDRLGTVERGAPGTEVQSFDVFVGNFSHAQLERKIGSSRNRAAMFVKGPEPALGPGEKGHR